jgi:UDP-N-acetylglucosamine 2-epimerase (non-hydrolysing)
MIHVFIGTKAQFIKTAPVMMEMTRRGMPYHLIETGQHAALTADLTEEFGLREADTRLRTESTNIATLGQAALWSSETLLRLLSSPDAIARKTFRGEKKGVCLVHGDTLTTLFSLLYARRCGIPVAHVEAGLRSYHLFDPFPEELIRLAVMRYSDILFAPSDWAMGNLSRMGYGEKSINVRGNTVVDTIRFARARYTGKDRPGEPYVVVTIHRVETLYSSRRMNTVIPFLEEIARQRRVLFVLHEPTRRQLERLSLLDRLQRCSGIDMMPLQPYLKFLDLLAGADFAVTDGGSIQEECYSLNIPCLIMRAKTERMEGLGENAILAGFSRERFEDFLKALPVLKRRDAESEGVSPSSIIVDHLEKYLERHG